MTTRIIDNNGILSLGSISSEKDLKIKAGVNINPPPKDGWCVCCGRHISELTPFGKAGDPLVGDFDGELLIKKFRTIGPYDEKADQALKYVEMLMEKEGCTGDYLLEWMEKIYGKEKGERYHLIVDAYSQGEWSWECRECAVLDTDEYFEQIEKTYSNKKIQ